MTQEKATVTWTKDDPVEDGVYWWRADATDFEPDIHSVVNSRFYQVGEMHSEAVEGFGGEWLGPITADDLNERNALLSEVVQLREALLVIEGDGKCARASCHYRGSHDADRYVAIARAALAGKEGNGDGK